MLHNPEYAQHHTKTTRMFHCCEKARSSWSTRLVQIYCRGCTWWVDDSFSKLLQSDTNLPPTPSSINSDTCILHMCSKITILREACWSCNSNVRNFNQRLSWLQLQASNCNNQPLVAGAQMLLLIQTMFAFWHGTAASVAVNNPCQFSKKAKQTVTARAAGARPCIYYGISCPVSQAL